MLNELKQTLNFIIAHPLGGRNKIAALWRFFSWQLRCRLSKKPMIADFVDDSKLVIDRGMTGATGNYYCGLHEFEDMAFLLHFTRPEDLFVDIGANVGSYTVLASAVCGSHCVTVEPVPSTFSKLVRNVEANRMTDKTELHNCGLSAHNGSLRFTAVHDTMNRVLRDDETDIASIDVPVKTLDDLLDSRVATLIKLDVEGHEIEVLRGALQTFENDGLQAVIMEVNSSGEHYGVGNQSLLAFMTDRGFGFYSYSPFNRKLIAISNPESKGGNVICIRDLDAAMARVRDAKPFSVLGNSI